MTKQLKENYDYLAPDGSEIRKMVIAETGSLAHCMLPTGQWLRAMFDAHAVLVGMIRGRLRTRYPELSGQDLNVKVIDEIERATRLPSCPDAPSRRSP